MPERKFLVSTDSSGLFGFPDTWRKVWFNTIEQDKSLRAKFSGFEMLAWSLRGSSNWTNALYERAKEYGVPVAAMHGRMGVNEYSSHVNQIQNELLLPTSQLLNQAQGLDYLLVHATEAVRPQVYNRIAQNCRGATRLFLENSSGEEELNLAVSLAEKVRRLGVPAGVMIDLAHFGVRGIFEDGQWRSAWNQLMPILDEILECRELPVGIHFPVGPNLCDSLPLDKMDDCMLRDFADLIEGRAESLTIENQQLGRSNLWLESKDIDPQRKRNERVLERLQKVGVI